MKKKITVFIIVILVLLLSVPAFLANAKVVSVNISGSSYPKAGNTYTYTALPSFNNGSSSVTYSWSLSGANGVSISSNGSSCRMTLKNSASGYGILRVTANSSDGSSASREFAFNVVKAPTTTKKPKPSTTKPKQTTTKPRTTKPSTTKPRTTKPSATKPKRTTTKPRITKPRTTKPRTTKPRTTNPYTTKPRTTKPSTIKPTTTKSTTETTKNPETTTIVTTEATQNYAKSSLGVVTQKNGKVVFKWNNNKSDFYNLYISKDNEHFVLIYSGTGTSYTANKLIHGFTYSAYVECLSSKDGSDVVNTRSNTMKFIVSE